MIRDNHARKGLLSEGGVWAAVFVFVFWMLAVSSTGLLNDIWIGLVLILPAWLFVKMILALFATVFDWLRDATAYRR